MRIIRKATGNVVTTDVPEDQVEAVLSALPSGVYTIENAAGIDTSDAVVRGGYVDYRSCVGCTV